MKGIKSNIFKVLQNSKYTDEIVGTRFTAVYLRCIDRGEGVSPSWYYSYTLKVTTGARRPRPYQLNLREQHWNASLHRDF